MQSSGSRLPCGELLATASEGPPNLPLVLQESKLSMPKSGASFRETGNVKLPHRRRWEPPLPRRQRKSRALSTLGRPSSSRFWKKQASYHQAPGQDSKDGKAREIGSQEVSSGPNRQGSEEGKDAAHCHDHREDDGHFLWLDPGKFHGEGHESRLA